MGTRRKIQFQKTCENRPTFLVSAQCIDSPGMEMVGYGLDYRMSVPNMESDGNDHDYGKSRHPHHRRRSQRHLCRLAPAAKKPILHRLRGARSDRREDTISRIPGLLFRSRSLLVLARNPPADGASHPIPGAERISPIRNGSRAFSTLHGCGADRSGICDATPILETFRRHDGDGQEIRG